MTALERNGKLRVIIIDMSENTAGDLGAWGGTVEPLAASIRASAEEPPCLFLEDLDVLQAAAPDDGARRSFLSEIIELIECKKVHLCAVICRC